MSNATRTRELLLTLAQSIVDADSRDDLTKCDNLQILHSSLEDAIKSVVVAQNELSLINKLPPETIIIISEFIIEPGSRKSIFELVKMTHICQYWRSTLISCPRLWSSIFVKHDHKDFVTACLERSQELPLSVHLDLKYGDYHEFDDCTCIRNEWSPGMYIDEDNPCRYHTTIEPLMDVDSIKRIRKLDVFLTMLDGSEEGPDHDFHDALDNFQFFVFPLPFLESFSFSVDYEEFDSYIDTHLSLPGNLFCWMIAPPTKLRHLSLHGCYGGPILAVHNLTSFELSGYEDYDPIQLGQRAFLPFISGSPSLVSLALSRCEFPDREKSSRATPVKLSELKTLRLINVYGLTGLPGIIEVPAFKTLSSLHISTRKEEGAMSYVPDFEVRAENDDGFRLFYDSQNNDELASEWLGITRNADSSPALVRLEGRDLHSRDKYGMRNSPLPLFVNAKVLEIGASFAGRWYRDFWKDLGNIGSQLTTLRLEVVEGMDPTVAESVRGFAKARLEKGMPLMKLERMKFKGLDEEGEEKAEKLWEEFRAGLNIDQYLSL